MATVARFIYNWKSAARCKKKLGMKENGSIVALYLFDTVNLVRDTVLFMSRLIPTKSDANPKPLYAVGDLDLLTDTEAW